MAEVDKIRCPINGVGVPPLLMRSAAAQVAFRERDNGRAAAGSAWNPKRFAELLPCASLLTLALGPPGWRTPSCWTAQPGRQWVNARGAGCCGSGSSPCCMRGACVSPAHSLRGNPDSAPSRAPGLFGYAGCMRWEVLGAAGAHACTRSSERCPGLHRADLRVAPSMEVGELRLHAPQALVRQAGSCCTNTHPGVICCAAHGVAMAAAACWNNPIPFQPLPPPHASVAVMCRPRVRPATSKRDGWWHR